MQRIVFSQGCECKKWQEFQSIRYPPAAFHAGLSRWRQQLAATYCSGRYETSALPTSIDLAPLALYSGRGVGGEGFCTVF